MKEHKSRNTVLNREWRNFVLKRDNYKCKKCDSSKKLHVHHIIKWDENVLLRYDVDNGITLCASCHVREHKKGKPNYKNRGRIISSEQLEMYRIRAIGNKNMLGKFHSEESKNKMKLAKIGKVTWLTGKKLSDEHKKNISKSKIGKKGIPKTDEWKRKISESNKGKLKGKPSWNKGIPMSEKSKKILSDLRKNKTWIIDEITGKRKWVDKIYIQ